METLLVTGCAGFIGSNFCRLFGREFRLVGLDALVRGSDPGNLPPGMPFYRGDIADEALLSAVFDAHPDLSGAGIAEGSDDVSRAQRRTLLRL